ncbi:vitamin K epoxide reductase family protein [Flagellimonas sp. S174]|uniref:vitamin K epoxide reductase family protein n=1 Tax=Flagellimonas sp. S174 TaxID=3410790 RepID=UPI003BF50271
MDSTLSNTLLGYLKALNIKVSSSELKLQLFSHPYTPSLFAVSETLNFLKIDNVAAEVEHRQLEYLPDNFIALINDDGKEEYFAHVKKLKRSIQLNEQRGHISYEDFCKMWSGVVLIAEKNDEKRRNTLTKNSIILYTLLLIPLIFFWSKPLILIYGILGIIGLVLSEEIFKTTNQVDSYLADKICGNEEKGKGCSTVLNDTRYRLFSFSLNDFLFSFFISTLVYTLWNTIFDVTHILLYVVAFLMVCATIFIQKFIVKSWCRLCLLSSFCIIGQAILVFVHNFYIQKEVVLYSEAGSFVAKATIFVFLFTLSLLMVDQYRRLRKNNYQMTKDVIELLRFKRSPKVVSQMISSGKKISSFIDLNPLGHNNTEAHHIIRLVISTTCNFCKDSFNQFYEYYLNNKDDNEYQIIFNHFEEKNSKRNRVAVSLINIYRNNGFDALMQSLNQWFNERHNSTFLEEYLWKTEDENVYTLHQQRAWCKKNELFHTPILIIDEVVISEYYDASFIGDLVGEM